MSAGIKSNNDAISLHKRLMLDTTENIVNDLKALAGQTECDGIKVYFQNDSRYVFKFIKDDKVVSVIRKGRNCFDNKK